MSVIFLVRGDVAVLPLPMTWAGERSEILRLLDHLVPTAVASRKTASNQWSPGASYRLDECLFFNLSDVGNLKRTLQDQDLLVEVHRQPSWPQLRNVVPLDQHTGATYWEQEALEAAAKHAWGQIVVPRGHAAGMIVAIARSHPRLNTLVICKNNKMVNRVTRQLRADTHRNISTGVDVPWAQRPLVHVQAISGLDRCGHDWPVVIFADAESVRSDTGMQVAVSMSKSLIYSILPREQRLDSEDQLRIRLVSGPEIYRAPDKSFGHASICVLRMSAPRLRTGVPANPLARKLVHIWKNPRRIEMVAQLAEAFATGKIGQLINSGFRAREVLALRQRMGDEPRVAIIVESPQHARHLHRKLPGWRVLVGSRVADKHLPILPIDEQRVITTLARATRAGIAADVVIRADGTSLEWDSAWGPHICFWRGQMIVVDIGDHFDRLSVVTTSKRISDYHAHRWKLVPRSSKIDRMPPANPRARLSSPGNK